MAGEWREATIGELAWLHDEQVTPTNAPAELFHHFSIPAYDSGQKPAVEPGSAIGSNKYVVPQGGVLVSRLNPRIPRVWAPQIPAKARAVASTEFLVLRPRDGGDPGFLKYLMLSPTVRSEMEARVTGTSGSHQRVRPSDLLKISVRIPRAPHEQLAIAHILGTLDDKIELNRRMSETLEAMARALFKAWFVDFEPVRAKMEGRWQRGQSLPGLPAHLYDLFPDRLVDSELGEIPEGWEVGTLGKFFRAGPSGAWGQDEPSGGSAVRVRCLRGIDCHDLAEGRVPEAPVRWLTANQAHARRLDNGAILIEGSGSFCGRSLLWNPAYAELFEEPVLYSNFCKRLDPLCSASQALVGWFHICQAYREGELQAFRTGTAFPNFDIRGLLMNLIVVMPPEPLARLFADVLNIRRRVSLMKESRTLAALRDALLPKLISGELRVKDAERFLKERGL